MFHLCVYFLELQNWIRAQGCQMTLVVFSPEIAAWLAENGPISVALNAFAMQVCRFVASFLIRDNIKQTIELWQTQPSAIATSTIHKEMKKCVLSYSFLFEFSVLQERCISPFEDFLQPLDDWPRCADGGIWRTWVFLFFIVCFHSWDRNFVSVATQNVFNDPIKIPSQVTTTSYSLYECFSSIR